MSNVAKLKKQAAEFELKKQFDKALELYTRILEQSDGGDEEVDVALYNRVGDLTLRRGNVAGAVRYYEQAVERYAAAGLLNNAIALCNKILRHAPGRASVYHTLGVISAKKGFISDAKQNFLEYAERMQQAGQMDDAVRALQEFAELCPEEDDVRLLLAEHLSKTDRKGEAVEQLQSLYEKFAGEGRQEEARLTATRIEAIDATLVPRMPSERRAPQPAPRPAAADLVFIDVSYDAAKTDDAPADASDVAEALEPTTRSAAATPEAPTASPLDDLIDLDAPAPTAAPRRAALHDLSLPGDLPMLEVAFDDPAYAVLASSRAATGSTGGALDDDFLLPLDVEPVTATPMVDAEAAGRVSRLLARVNGAPGDWSLRRELAEALFEDGNREGAIAELEVAMEGFEAAGDLGRALGVAVELIRVAPDALRHHERRVELATALGDSLEIREAHEHLADAQFRGGRVAEARTSYTRLLALAPNHAGALAALETLDGGTTPRRATPPVAAPAASPATPIPAAAEESFIDLGDLLRDDDDDEQVRSTRMITSEPVPTGDEEVDFQVMLRKFKEGIARNVADEDFDSHYDLGVAFKEMGLLDEAIAEFQKALRAPGRRVRAYEALGQCFLEKTHYEVALTVLSRALVEAEIGDDELVGVLYLLGYASEALQRWDDAQSYYQRVLATDIQFRDAADRLALLSRAAR
jgi:tetratricopeptide (TPR) repeat protein